MGIFWNRNTTTESLQLSNFHFIESQFHSLLKEQICVWVGFLELLHVRFCTVVTSASFNKPAKVTNGKIQTYDILSFVDKKAWMEFFMPTLVTQPAHSPCATFWAC